MTQVKRGGERRLWGGGAQAGLAFPSEARSRCRGGAGAKPVKRGLYSRRTDRASATGVHTENKCGGTCHAPRSSVVGAQKP